MPSQSMLCWSAKPVDSPAHLFSVLLALLKRRKLKSPPRYRSRQQRRSQRGTESPKKSSQQQECDIVFPVQKPGMRVIGFLSGVWQPERRPKQAPAFLCRCSCSARGTARPGAR